MSRRDLEVTLIADFEIMKKNCSVFISSISRWKVSLIKRLGTLMNRGLFQFPQLKVSRCDFNGSSANEPDHSKLSDGVSKANDPNVSDRVEATRTKGEPGTNSAGVPGM